MIIGPVFPNKVNNKWPAIIFAANRTARVNGRIIFLIVSMHTIKGIRIGGVPWGTRWANICCVLLIHPYSMNVNQNGSARDNVNVKWLELVKMKGNSPRRLLNRIIENREMNINDLPKFLLFTSRVLNSECNL